MILERRAFVLVGEDRARQFSEYHLSHRQMARHRTGLDYDLPDVGATYPRSSIPALQAAKWVEANHPDSFDEYDLALFDAFFRASRDISDPELLASLADQLGMPGSQLTTSIRAGDFLDAIWTDYSGAVEAGISGIPTVIIGGSSITGAVPYEEYRAALQAVLK